MAKVRIKFNDKGWDQIAGDIIENEGVPRMKRVADACNSHIESDGYKVSVEGDEALRKRDFRATVITANYEAIRDNARNNRLVSEFYRAGGE